MARIFRVRAAVAKPLMGGATVPPAAPVVTPLGPPNSVAGSVTATSGTISWAPPTGTGGNPITAWRVARNGVDSTGFGAFTTDAVAPTRSSFTFASLVPGATYVFSVAAITGATVGPTSSVTVTIPAAATDDTLGGLLPAKGTGATLGLWQAGNGDVRQIEVPIQRKAEFVHLYQPWSGHWPNSTQLQYAQEGRTLWCGWETINYSVGAYLPTEQSPPAITVTMRNGSQRQLWTYAQIYNGECDVYIDKQADIVKTIPGRVVIDIDHEMDDQPYLDNVPLNQAVGGGSSDPRRVRSQKGDASEYVRAYRYIVDRFRARGVTNVAWAITYAGWGVAYSAQSRTWFGALYPGNSYVDIIAWDPYFSTSKTVDGTFGTFYREMQGTNGAATPLLLGGTTASMAIARAKPLFVAEWGAETGYSNNGAGYPNRSALFTDMPNWAPRYPNIRGFMFYSSGPNNLVGDTTALAAWKTAWSSPYLDPFNHYTGA